MVPAAFHKSAPPAGSRPGTLAIPEGSPPPRLFVFRYGPDTVTERELADVEELASLQDGAGVTWVDVQGLGDERILRRIAEIFRIDPLALEDAVNVPQRAKSDVRGEHQVIVVRLPLVGQDRELSVPQVCLLLGERVLITFQERFFDFFGPVRERIRAGIGPLRKLGPDYLAYALIDTVIDRFYPVVEALSEELEELEEEVVEDAVDSESLARIHRIRRDLVVLRRVGWPQREAVSALLRERTPYVSDEVRSYLRDTFDHVSQIMELVDASREMSIGLLDIHMSNVSNRTNDVMKVLTLMASIFIPLTFVAGIYGMNFEYMPELSSRMAYPVVLTTMFGIAGGMLGYFYYKGWIGSRRRRRLERRQERRDGPRT